MGVCLPNGPFNPAVGRQLVSQQTERFINMIKLANRFPSPEGIPKDYLVRYVNRRVIDAVSMYIDIVEKGLTIQKGTQRTGEEKPPCQVADEGVQINITDKVPEMIAVYEYGIRTETGDNGVVPMSVPTEPVAIKKWVAAVMKELVDVLNGEDEKVPSVEGEYLLFNIIMSVVGYFTDMHEGEGQVDFVSETPTREIVNIAVHHAFAMKEMYESIEDKDEDTESEEWFAQTMNDAIDDMTNLGHYVGMVSTDNEMLIWDWDYKLLDEIGQIPQIVKDFAGIWTNDDAYEQH